MGANTTLVARTFDIVRMFASGATSSAVRSSIDIEEEPLSHLVDYLSAVDDVPPTTQIAILVDSDSYDRRPAFTNFSTWQRTAWEQGYGVRMLTDIDQAIFESLIIIDANQTNTLPHSAIEHLAESGNQVLLIAPSTTQPSDSAFAKTAGVQFEGESHLQRLDEANDATWHLTGRLTEPSLKHAGTHLKTSTAPLKLTATDPSLERTRQLMNEPRPALRAANWARVFTPGDSTTTLASVDDPLSELDGHPIITKRAVANAHGEAGGNVWLVGADLDAFTRATLLRLISVHARIRPMNLQFPRGIEVVQRAHMTFIVNHGSTMAELSNVHGLDVISGNTCTGHVALAPHSVMVVVGE
ncbi:hypothetical protein QP759_06540 [Actinomycetaceae bacterium UMB8039B]|uniref:hypothetical protein n=1 Tax=unclassified Pauljensenia TaxID=2908895 RepID=UPI000A88CB04|nr:MULTISPECIES: hypothetical protein [unclassified Pauljensenia]MDK7780186.1 hypothetical protein [Actinomycetaceae bacterium UMB8041B]MDK8294166.1 hypothetical protein [Actinomycetaceae bacterium UMB8039B]MDK8608016.1 hypothetical protein [Actinomycetaceae bacterium UMB8041A]MDK8753375.1 hypothetical protein [Actinomycetaceae bacterium UMB8039A]MDK6831037.1 hypothetical protein [Pauljensenia sp. UMB8040A]